MKSYIEFLCNTLKLGSVIFSLTMFPMRNMLSSISLFLCKCVISYCFTDFLFVAGFEQFDYDISLFIYPVNFLVYIFLKFEHFSAFTSSNTFASPSQLLLHNSQKHISLLTLSVFIFSSLYCCFISY